MRIDGRPIDVNRGQDCEPTRIERAIPLSGYCACKEENWLRPSLRIGPVGPALSGDITSSGRGPNDHASSDGNGGAPIGLASSDAMQHPIKFRDRPYSQLAAAL